MAKSALIVFVCFNSQPPCGGRRVKVWLFNISISVSTHSLLAEADGLRTDIITTKIGVSTHSLLAEADDRR